MRDWQRYVRANLCSLRVNSTEFEEVAQELAAHLEETYERLRLSGLPEGQADLQTRAQAGNWKELNTQLNSAKQEGTMNARVKRIWIPSLLTLLTCWTILALLIWAGAQPLIWNRAEPRSAILYLPWLLLLPLIGAMGGYLSRREDGAGYQVYVAGTFPALAIAAILAVTFPFAFFVDPRIAPDFKLDSLLAMVLSWVILPGIALCAGVAFVNRYKPALPVKAGTT